MVKEQRQAKMAYSYDRLWEQKLAQVYRLLIPDKHNYNRYLPVEPIERIKDENSCYLCQSVLGPAKGK